MLSFVGLGLWGEDDITVKGIKEIEICDQVFIEFYTSMMNIDLECIEKKTGKKIHILSREQVEDGRELLDSSEKKHVCLLVGGDSMTATTHVDLRIRAAERGIETKVVHGVSIVTAAASLLGLQIYKFGKVISIAKPSCGFFPLSPYDSLKDNMTLGFHSLLLLDTEKSCMTANEGLFVLCDMEKQKGEGIIHDDLLVAVVGRVSSNNQTVKAGKLGEMYSYDFGDTPHSIVIPGKLHIMEKKALMILADAPSQ